MSIKVYMMDSDTDFDYIDEQISEYNYSKVGKYEYEKLILCIRDQQNRIIGGLSGHTGLDWLYIHLLWVDEPHRGFGYGIKLMEKAEKEAINRGCHSAYLYSYYFQAPSFYEGLGYEKVCILQDFPKGHQKIFLKKRSVDESD